MQVKLISGFICLACSFKPTNSKVKNMQVKLIRNFNPFPKVLCKPSLSQRFKLFASSFPFSRVTQFQSLDFHFPFLKGHPISKPGFPLSLSQGSPNFKAWIPFFKGSFVLQGWQGRLVLDEDVHSQLQAVKGCSTKLTPPPMLLVFCFD